MDFRTEKDTMGKVMVQADKLWGAQTQRSLENFRIGSETMPSLFIHSYAQLKKACAVVNHSMGLLDKTITAYIVQACDEIIEGLHDDQFPLSIWQTGSGTQTNMNLNEVIANRASLLAGGQLDGDKPVHPNDHVNRSQSSNDTFPTVMHMAAVSAIEQQLIPVLEKIRSTLKEQSVRYQDLVKIGRTHLQDATPLTLGQEISGWEAMIKSSRQQLREALNHLQNLTIGGTAVGTGLNAPDGFGLAVVTELNRQMETSFSTTENTFHGLTSHDQMVFAHGALKGLAANMMKIANDIRWLASGPRCGIGELAIPANEPGSSIMPGKVNPTQAEAMTMVACQVMGNDAAIGFAASQGNFQLNVFKPVILYNFLQSVGLLADAISSFHDHCLWEMEPVPEKIALNLNNSLMLVTALNPYIGYENSAKIAKLAFAKNISLKQAAIELDLLTEEQFEQYVDPQKMMGKIRDNT
ncbi:class II fumarate hydratase [Desulfogranum japonicum]|uniref:class II fumarate hydratase n=1 Tax=Desulfogranum japonicum TaxID=231447 RepID=UPI0003F9E493|nr:class II fumarate hydratase [Desulfogranum japonicum]